MQRPRVFALGAAVVVLAVVLVGANVASGGTGNRSAARHIAGKHGVSVSRGGVHAASDLGSIDASHTYDSAGYQTGGTALRNQRRGAITINGVTGGVHAAWLYWAFITTGPGGPAQSHMVLQRKWPGSTAAVNLAGTSVGTGPSPCWAGDTITVYRAPVPTTVASGNGYYVVTVRPSAASSYAGQAPWFSGLPPPLAEGASLVIVSDGSGTTALYDAGLAGQTYFGGTQSYTLNLPGTASGTSTLWDSIGADGQSGDSAREANAAAVETTSINGTPIAGPGSQYTDSDWNGSDGKPSPQLWDTAGHDISTLVAADDTSIDVVETASSDCLTPVANIVAFG